MNTWPAEEAKHRFEELLDACMDEGPQTVTVGGVDAAVLVAATTWTKAQSTPRYSLKELLLCDSARTETLTRRR